MHNLRLRSRASGQSKGAKYTPSQPLVSEQDYSQREESEISDVRNVGHALEESCIQQTSSTDQKGKRDEFTRQKRSSSTRSKMTEKKRVEQPNQNDDASR